MYHFVAGDTTTTTTKNAAPLILSPNKKVPARICQYLKSFQLNAIRFLYDHLAKQEFAILNDESGLGKSATIAVLLSAVLAKDKKCLIVVQNNETILTAWQFHFDVLTDLAVTVLQDNAQSCAQQSFNVHLATWSTLRAIGDLSKLHFDLIIVDNRGQMLNNSFCTALLLKNYQRKVNILVSSTDITSDTKLMYNVLRLGGRLDSQFENFKIFEQKFRLPDSTQILQKKIDLETYFLRREVLSNYCKDFRLRRYRHQYEHLLPLVETEEYKRNLELWRCKKLAATNSVASSDIVEVVDVQTQSEENPFPDELHHDIKQECIINNEVENIISRLEMQHNTYDIVDICEEPVVMSPLLFVTDSEDEESDDDIERISLLSDTNPNDDEVVELSSESKEIENELQQNSIAIVTVSSEGKKVVRGRPLKRKQEKQTKEKTVAEEAKPNLTIDQVSEVRQTRNAKKTNASINQKEKSSQIATHTQKIKDSTKKTTSTVTRGMELKKHTAKKETTNAAAPTTVRLDENDTNLKEITRQIAKRKLRVIDNKEQTIPEKRKISNRRNEQTKEQRVNKTTITIAVESKRKDVATSPKSKQKSAETSNSTTKSPKTPTNAAVPMKQERACSTPSAQQRRMRLAENTPLHTKDTRLMERTTRSAGKLRNYMRTTLLALDIDMKPYCNMMVGRKHVPKYRPEKPQHTKQRKEATKLENIDKKLTKSNTKSTTNNPSSKNNHKNDNIIKNTTNASPNKSITTKTQRQASQISVLSSSPEFEDIQCGQKLTFDSSSEGSVRTSKQNNNASNKYKTSNGFLIPPTPTLTSASVVTSNNTTAFLPSLTLFGNNSDLLMLTQKSPRAVAATPDIITVNSSQDEGSQSMQSRRTRALKRKKVADKPKHQQGLHPMTTLHNFSDILAKQQQPALRHSNKSPDLFSNYSEALSNAGAMLTQAQDKNTFEGFKIFGSEVKQFQQQHAASAKQYDLANNKRLVRKRSCLNILEKMFEPRDNNKQTPKTRFARSKSAHNILPTLPNDINHNAMPQGKSQAKTATNNNERPTTRSSALDEDIFEITSNGTFGSVMRVNSNGNISPVATQQQQQLKTTPVSQNNKITNYLTQTAPEQTTPSKQRITQRQAQPQLSGTAARKSPKSGKTITATQANQLTKWLQRKVDVIEQIPSSSRRAASIFKKFANDELLKTCTKQQARERRTPIKRRRLDLTN